MPFGEARTLGFNNQPLARLIVANSIINKQGMFFYSSTPAFGNLIESVGVTTAGTDRFGNAYLAGETTYAHAPLSAVNINGATVTWWTATGAGGPWIARNQVTLFHVTDSAQFFDVGIAGTPNKLAGGFAAGNEFWLPPSGDTTGATDTANINTVLGFGNTVLHLLPGTFTINAVLTPGTNQSIIGAGAGATVINQVTNAAEGIRCTNKSTITLRGFTLVGTGALVSTAAGIHFDSNPPTANHILDDVIVQNFGLQGFIFDSVFLTELRKCESLQNGGIGFQVTNSFAVPTSFSFHTCYANGNGGNGFEFDGLQYSHLGGCAADGNPTGYALFGCQGVTLTGCGTEVFTATGFLFNNCKGCALYGGFTFNGKTKVVWVTNGTSRQTVGGLTETSPAAGATACLQVDAGTTCIAWGITHVTADSLAAGTTTNVDGSA